MKFRTLFIVDDNMIIIKKMKKARENIDILHLLIGNNHLPRYEIQVNLNKNVLEALY